MRRPRSPPDGAPSSVAPHVVVGAVNLAQSIRRYGHLAAQIDPLGSRPIGDPALLPETHGVTEAELRALPADLIAGPVAARRVVDVGRRRAAARDLLRRRPATTSRTSSCPRNARWLREAIETGRFRAPADPIDPMALLDRLTQVEAFERFLQRTFPGKTRFSIEGLDMLVPILDEVIGEAAEVGHAAARSSRMAHRGRLNVMAHVLGKPYEQILAEFKDPVAQRARDRRRAVEPAT